MARRFQKPSWASAAGEPAQPAWHLLSGPEVPEARQKDRIKFRASEALTQDEFALDGLAFPFFPLFAHRHPPTRIDSNSRKSRRGVYSRCLYGRSTKRLDWATSETTEGSRRRGLGACRPIFAQECAESNRVPVDG